jgi:hypothetical protein
MLVGTDDGGWFLYPTAGGGPPTLSRAPRRPTNWTTAGAVMTERKTGRRGSQAAGHEAPHTGLARAAALRRSRQARDGVALPQSRS